MRRPVIDSQYKISHLINVLCAGPRKAITPSSRAEWNCTNSATSRRRRKIAAKRGNACSPPVQARRVCGLPSLLFRHRILYFGRTAKTIRTFPAIVRRRASLPRHWRWLPIRRRPARQALRDCDNGPHASCDSINVSKHQIRPASPGARRTRPRPPAAYLQGARNR